MPAEIPTTRVYLASFGDFARNDDDKSVSARAYSLTRACARFLYLSLALSSRNELSRRCGGGGAAGKGLSDGAPISTERKARAGVPEVRSGFALSKTPSSRSPSPRTSSSSSRPALFAFRSPASLLSPLEEPFAFFLSSTCIVTILPRSFSVALL